MLDNYLSHSFSRLLLFIVIFLVIVFALEAILPYELIYWNLHVPFSLIVASSIAESLRKNSKWHLFGLTFSRDERRNILIGLALPLLIFMAITLLAVSMGSEFRLAEEVNLGQLTKTAFLMLTIVLGEELIFRGFLLSNLSEWLGNVSAVLILSILFALGHSFNPNLTLLGIFNIFLASILFSVMYLKTGTIWLPLSFHFSWNFLLSSVFGINVSGYKYGNSILENDLGQLLPSVFGGEFGVEGGILTSVMLMVTFPIILNYTSKNLTAQKLTKRRWLIDK